VPYFLQVQAVRYRRELLSHDTRCLSTTFVEQVCQNINPNIYGEVTADGCALMFKNLPSTARLDDDSVIYDLGSGYGKFTYDFAKLLGVGTAFVASECTFSRLLSHQRSTQTRKKSLMTTVSFCLNCVLPVANGSFDLLPCNSIWCGSVAKKRSIGIENNSERATAAEKAYKSAVDKGLLSAEDQARITLKEVNKTS